MAVLVQISDVHLPDQRGTQRPDLPCPDAHLEQILAAIADRHTDLDALVITGDLTEDAGPGAYDRLARAIVEAPWSARPAVLAIPGNHDDPEVLHDAGRRHGWMTRGVWAPGVQDPESGTLWRVALLDSHVPGEVFGRVDAAMLDDVEAVLHESVPAGAHPRTRSLAFVHHPPRPLGSPWMDRLALVNGDTLLERLATWPGFTACGFGHAHQAFDDPATGCYGTPSTWVQFLPGAESFQLDLDAAPGWRVWRLHDDGRLTTEVQRLTVAH